MTKNNFGYKAINELQNLYRSKEISPVEVTKEAIENINLLNPKLRAFITITEKYAIEKAKEAEKTFLKGEKPKLLTGIPIAIKDVEPMANYRCTFGSLVRDGIAQEDSMTVRRIKESGGVILGKTNTPEYGHAGTSDNRVFGSSFNPWDIKKTPGGSSGGSAAAVAAGITSIGQGGDGGGSIRIPGSFCGIYGIKPTQGRISRIVDGSVRWNVVNNATSGPLSRHVEDAAILLQVLAGYSDEGEYINIKEDPEDYLGSLRKSNNYKIAFSNSVGDAEVDNEVSKIVKESLNKFTKETKSEISEFNFYPESAESIYQVFFDFFCTKGYASDPILLEDENNNKLITDYVKRNWEHGKKVTGNRMFECYNKIGFYRDYTNKLFKNYDILILPTMATTAFDVNNPPESINGKKTNDPLWDFTPLTYIFNLTGNPAATLPIGFSKNKLPIGLQIVGDMGREHDVLNLSKQFQTIFEWEKYRAPTAV